MHLLRHLAKQFAFACTGVAHENDKVSAFAFASSASCSARAWASYRCYARKCLKQFPCSARKCLKRLPPSPRMPQEATPARVARRAPPHPRMPQEATPARGAGAAMHSYFMYAMPIRASNRHQATQQQCSNHLFLFVFFVFVVVFFVVLGGS